jgi:Ser/Thr protein kinase RdoA (MazF antagonist)
VDQECVFQGGVNTVRRRGPVVHRPATRNTPTLHRLLGHLADSGFVGAPRPVGFDGEGNEILTFVNGTVRESWNEQSRTPELLSSAAVLLRQMHDATTTFPRNASDRWLLPERDPHEVICHGDFAPYNVAVAEGKVVGVIDFDTAHPGPRLWDVAYAVYRFAPLHAPSNPESVGDLRQQARLAAAFCQTYGIAADAGLLDTVAARLEALMDFMRTQAASGDAAFAGHLRDGHLELYQTDLAYLRENREVLLTHLAN